MEVATDAIFIGLLEVTGILEGPEKFGLPPSGSISPGKLSDAMTHVPCRRCGECWWDHHNWDCCEDHSHGWQRCGCRGRRHGE